LKIASRGPVTAGGSGLTGPVDIPDEAGGGAPSDLRGRLLNVWQAAAGTVTALPRVVRLVWEASPWLTVGLGVAAVANGVMPAATAYTARLLVNTVLHAIAIRLALRSDQVVLTLGLPGVTLRSPVLSSTAAIVTVAAAQFAIFALTSVFNTLRSVTQQLLQERVSTNVQLEIMEHASRLDLTFFEDAASYDLLRQAQKESSVRPVAMVGAAFGLIQTIITFGSMVALLLAVSPLLALVALVAPIPAFISESRYGWRTFLVARWASPLRRRMEYLMTLVTTDTFAKEVKLFDLGGYFVDRFRLLAATTYDSQRRVVTARGVIGNAWSAISTLAGSLTYLYVALQAAAGRLTLGDLTLYTAAATTVQSSIQSVLQSTSTMYEHNLYLNHLFELLATPAEVVRPVADRPPSRPSRGRVAFEHVSFSYSGAAAPALQDVSFEIVPGEMVAIVGPNGAGKTTLIKLLCRMYEPGAGRILVDRVDVRDVDPGELRAGIGAMFQDYVMYQATAAENVGLGELAHVEDRARIEDSVRRAGAEGLVGRLPKGLDTPLGKWFARGVNLSGGEWQKIALARAFMRDVPILVLDEPTAALDARAEHDLFERLRVLAQGRTTLYVSHRFSTVRQADRILFLDEGRLLEEGTHAELMRLDGRYASLFAMQASAYAAEPA
jgi:ATP-binding cassette, subfamily B, bacterial